ncbi:alpha/beta fold hydrolase [Bacillus sp. FJAT-45037]|uniref:alpha/beta fold hydrolase n=1 Tax=Bacillus sp. FJAT-45037 TaxID=2011007 RepID=UPI000C2466DA|nr:alpha/beta hydrolase [Bacillus sp. FJAT-45037]
MKTTNVLKSIVYIRGTDVYYERYLPIKKKKGTLVFIHGFVSSSYSFRYLIPYFRKYFEVICVDLPGFGRSGKQRTFCYSFSSYADLIIDFLKLFECENVTIIGHSMGGQVALYTAKKEPALIKRIVLLSSSGYLNRVRRRYVYASYMPFAKHMMKWWIGRRNVQQMFTQVVHNKKSITEDAVHEYSIPLADPHFCEGLIGLMRQREGDLKKEELQKITQPCLILWGDEDRIIPERIGRRLASDLAHSSFYCFKKSGHLLSEERPDDVAKKINAFLKEL